MTGAIDITADAVALQERDEFRAQGWLKVVAPAKVNLHLAVGARRGDGYHEVVTVMHAVNLHDVVYLRRKPAHADDPAGPEARLVACGDVPLPDLRSEENIAVRAVRLLADRTGRRDAGIEMRIEKNIPAQGGLGGGSSDAAAALAGAAQLWGLAPGDPVIEEAARDIGSDVAFFLHGGCALLGGAGDELIRSLQPSKRAIALVKPDGGVSTADAYRAFDDQPEPVPPDLASKVRAAEHADDIALFNNLAHASEALMPQLLDIRSWLASQRGVRDALLCGSGATTFALCDDFSAACRIVAAARKRGLWARATSLGSARAMPVSSEGTA